MMMPYYTLPHSILGTKNSLNYRNSSNKPKTKRTITYKILSFNMANM